MLKSNTINSIQAAKYIIKIILKQSAKILYEKYLNSKIPSFLINELIFKIHDATKLYNLKSDKVQHYLLFI